MQKIRTWVADAVRKTFILTGFDSVLARTTWHVSQSSLRGRLTPKNWHYPSPTIKMIERDGICFELDVSDYMEWCAYYGLATEPRNTLYGLARPRAVVFDVGTNVGETLLNFSKAVGDEGQVYGFEINPRTYGKCLRNMKINPFKNIRLFEVGLGDSEGELQMHSPTPGNSGGDRITRRPPAQGSRKVRVTTLDRFVAEQGIARIDLIKIDVEGFEMNVLLGAEASLRAHKPTLFIELGHRNLLEHGHSSRELLTFLEGLGYQMTHAVTGEIVRPLEPLENSHFDIICKCPSA